MKRFYLGLVLVSAIGVGALAGGGGAGTDPTDPVDPPNTYLGFSTSDSGIGEMANSGPSTNGDGYAGTTYWNFSVNGTTYPNGVTYDFVYQVDYYDHVHSLWTTVNTGRFNFIDPGSTSGTHAVDFFVNPLEAAQGVYGVTVWVVGGSNTPHAAGHYSFYYGTNYSHPAYTAATYSFSDSGDDPPITRPDLPPSGPSGPGSSS